MDDVFVLLDDVFVLLDDCHATALQPRSRLYRGFVRQHVCLDPTTLDAVWQQVQADTSQGLHATVFADYEWGSRLLQAGHHQIAPEDGVLRFAMFRSLQHLSSEQVDEWLAQQDGHALPSPAGMTAPVANLTPEAYADSVERIQQLIAAGETYQVNYTYRLHSQQFGKPLALYRRLRALQPVPFACLASLPAVHGPSEGVGQGHWVLSCSPELFVRHHQRRLTTRPMKGTAPREPLEPEAGDQATWLAKDTKNRAENVMIVDLLRNDLGRISEIGSVRVPQLCAVEAYRTVFQMTSTVESTLLPGLNFPDVLRALFPCGSITGAPKVHTMELIAQLEPAPRGLYCGAIGWIDAAQGGVPPDFCLSVAIRTVQLGPQKDAMRPAVVGVGGGVVVDSTAASEFAETQVKARFLTQLDPGFSLFESLLVTHGKPRQLPRHLHRLQASALALGFRFDAAHLTLRLQEHVDRLHGPGPYRVRIDLFHDGRCTVQAAALPPVQTQSDGFVLLTLTQAPLPDAERALLGHKTSLRSTYDSAIQSATEQGAFDTLFVNAQGYITEGGRSNVFVKLAGRWYTPPLDGSVLPGTMRSRVLRLSPSIVERPIAHNELQHAQALAVCNALRGVQRAKLREC